MGIKKTILGFDGKPRYRKGEDVYMVSHCIFPAELNPEVSLVEESIVIGDDIGSTNHLFERCIFVGETIRGQGFTRLKNCNLSLVSRLPTPSEMLRSFFWASLSRKSQELAMRLDMASHEHPELFLDWAKDGSCPYADSRFSVQVRFSPERKYFKKTFLSMPPPRPIDVLKSILKDTCPQWDWDSLRWIDHVFRESTPKFRNDFRRALLSYADLAVYELSSSEGDLLGRYIAEASHGRSPSLNVLNCFAREAGYIDYAQARRDTGIEALYPRQIPPKAIMEEEQKKPRNKSRKEA